MLDRGIINPGQRRSLDSGDIGRNLFGWYISMAVSQSRNPSQDKADAKSVLGVMGPASAPGGSQAQQCLRVELLRVFGADLSGQLDGFQPEGFIMGAENKAANKVTEVKGKIKKKAGQATDDTGLEAEGRAEEAKGDLKQAGEKVKNAFKK